MEELENLTMTQVVNYYANRVSKQRNISKSLAKKLFLNALMYNWVRNEIEDMIDSLMGIEVDGIDI